MAGQPRPTFVPADAGRVEVLSLVNRLKDNLVYERAILESMRYASGIGMLSTIEDQERRVNAIEDMRSESEAWLQTIYLSEQLRGVAQS